MQGQSRNRYLGYALTTQLFFAGLVVPAIADDAQNRALAAAYNASGHELFKGFVAAPGNIVFSPYSIGTAMAMVLSGARGETAAEMTAGLRHSLQHSEITEANAAVLAILNSHDRDSAASCSKVMDREGDRCDGPNSKASGWPSQPVALQSARLRSANALLVTKAGTDVVAPSYASLLKQKYAAEIFRNATLADINGWVSRRTEGKISKLFDQIDGSTEMVLVNAVYFKAAWHSAFNKSTTVDRDFNLSPSTKVKVQTMHQTGKFPVIARPGYRAIRIPYSVKSLSMVILLPDVIDGAAALARHIDAGQVTTLLADLRTPRQTELTMPRFKASFKTSIAGAFHHMGVKRVFSFAQADLSGITGRPPSQMPMAIDQIVHSAVIEVEEEGTQAAAATGVSNSRSISPAPRAEPFHIDRPFLFYIADDSTGTILFQGLISDPRQE